MCFGLVEKSQRCVPTAVWSQRDEGLQPFQTQAEMCSSEGGDTTKKSFLLHGVYVQYILHVLVALLTALVHKVKKKIKD